MVNEIKVKLQNLPDNVYVSMRRKYRESFFQGAIDLVGGKLKLSRVLGFNESNIITRYYCGRYFCPLSIIRKIISLYCDQDKLFKEVQHNIIEIKFGYRRSKSIRNPCFSFSFSKRMGNLVGHFIGDGGVGNKVSPYISYYSNKCPELIEEFENCLNIFGEVRYNKYPSKGISNIYVPFIVGVLLLEIFGSFRNKMGKILPKSILDSNASCKIGFLRALFDDEASVSESSRVISINMTDKCVIENTKTLLDELGIKSGKIGVEKYESVNKGIKYRLRISCRRYLKKFNDTISFTHPDKKRKLERCLKSYKYKYSYKKFEIISLMNSIIFKEKMIKTRDLAVRLGRVPRGRFHKHLTKLEIENKIVWDKGKGILRSVSNYRTN